MANNIELAATAIREFDKRFSMKAKSNIFAASPDMVSGFSANGTISILDVSTHGMGNYDKDNGYPDGVSSAVWKPHIITQDRAQSFKVDQLDDKQNMGLVFGNVMSSFMDEHVVTEVDAYRFAQIASAAGQKVGAGATLTSSTVLTAINAARKALMDANVELENTALIVSPETYFFMEENDKIVLNRGSNDPNGNINTTIASYNGAPVIVVPQNRLWTKIKLETGAGNVWGYSKDTVGGAKDINFMFVRRDVPQAITVHTLPRIFDPATYQSANAWKFDYRIFHDLLIKANSVNGIYLHHKA